MRTDKQASTGCKTRTWNEVVWFLCGTRYDNGFLRSKISFQTGRVGPEIIRNIQWNIFHPELSCKVVDIWTIKYQSATFWHVTAGCTCLLKLQFYELKIIFKHQSRPRECSFFFLTHESSSHWTELVTDHSAPSGSCPALLQKRRLQHTGCGQVSWTEQTANTELHTVRSDYSINKGWWEARTVELAKM